MNLARAAGKKWVHPKNRRKRKKKPVAPPSSYALGYLWQWYMDIRGAQGAGMTINPVSHQEILAWKTLYGIEADALDIDTLRQLDAAYMKALPKAEPPPKTG